MAKAKPTATFKTYIRQQRVNFSGSHNSLQRQDSNWIVRASQMLALLTTNAVTFPTPPVDLATLTSDIADYRNAVQVMNFKGNRGSAANKLTRDTQRTIVINDLAANSAYVQAIARTLYPNESYPSQVAILLSGGTANKKKGRLNLPFLFGTANMASKQYLAAKINRQPSRPTGLKIVWPKTAAGHTPGQTKIAWGKSKGAVSYIIYSCNATTGVVVGAVHSTTAAAYVSTLTIAQKDCIRVQAVGPFGTKSGLSQPIFYTAI